MDLRQERGDNGNEATEPEQDWKARKQCENKKVGNELVKNSAGKKIPGRSKFRQEQDLSNVRRGRVGPQSISFESTEEV